MTAPESSNVIWLPHVVPPPPEPVPEVDYVAESKREESRIVAACCFIGMVVLGLVVALIQYLQH